MKLDNKSLYENRYLISTIILSIILATTHLFYKRSVSRIKDEKIHAQIFYNKQLWKYDKQIDSLETEIYNMTVRFDSLTVLPNETQTKIIYKYAKTNPINSTASQQFTSILSKRYQGN